jgi:hypothetical protein
MQVNDTVVGSTQTEITLTMQKNKTLPSWLRGTEAVKYIPHKLLFPTEAALSGASYNR